MSGPAADEDERSTLDCRACGACCHGDEGWIGVDARDDERIEAAPTLAAQVVYVRQGSGRKRALRMLNGRCAALRRDADLFTCGIYEVRPSICREVMPGSAACEEARRLFRRRHPA